jgi:hypothetical protein
VVIQVATEEPDGQEVMANQDNQAAEDHKAIPDPADLTDPLEIPVPLLPALQLCQETPDLQATQDPMDPLDHPDLTDRTVSPADQDQRDLPVTLVRTETTEVTDRTVPPDHPAQLVKEVFARNTALLTVAFSLKMAG